MIYNSDLHIDFPDNYELWKYFDISNIIIWNLIEFISLA